MPSDRSPIDPRGHAFRTCGSAVIEGLQRDHALLAAFLEATDKIDWQALHRRVVIGQAPEPSPLVSRGVNLVKFLNSTGLAVYFFVMCGPTMPHSLFHFGLIVFARDALATHRGTPAVEQIARRRHMRIGSVNPTVRTRKHEVVSCCVAVSNSSDRLKSDFPKKQNACELKLNCFHQVRPGTR
jgi:hypothetical protein